MPGTIRRLTRRLQGHRLVSAAGHARPAVAREPDGDAIDARVEAAAQPVFEEEGAEVQQQPLGAQLPSRLVAGQERTQEGDERTATAGPTSKLAVDDVAVGD